MQNEFTKHYSPLADEKLKMVEYFIHHDLQSWGHITENTREIARVQKVEIVEVDKVYKRVKHQ